MSAPPLVDVHHHLAQPAAGRRAGLRRTVHLGEAAGAAGVAGSVACTIGTDDPARSQTTLSQGLAHAGAAGITPAALEALRATALRATLVDAAGRARIVARSAAR